MDNRGLALAIDFGIDDTRTRPRAAGLPAGFDQSVPAEGAVPALWFCVDRRFNARTRPVGEWLPVRVACVERDLVGVERLCTGSGLAIALSYASEDARQAVVLAIVRILWPHACPLNHSKRDENRNGLHLVAIRQCSRYLRYDCVRVPPERGAQLYRKGIVDRIGLSGRSSRLAKG